VVEGRNNCVKAHSGEDSASARVCDQRDPLAHSLAF